MTRREAPRAHLEVRLTPRAARAGIVVEGDIVRVRVTAPPVEGRANAALVALLAKRLGIPKRDVAVVRGQSSRVKRVAIEGLSAAEALARLAPRLRTSPLVVHEDPGDDE